jgi:hypothetical protein
MVQFERWQRIVQEVKVYSCNEKEAIVCEEVIWTPGPWRLVPPTWIGKDWMRMSKESAQVWFQELNKCTSWRWVDKKISGAMCRCLAVSLTGYYVAVCVLWSYLPRFQTFLNARSLPQFFGEIMQRCDINIYIYVCMWIYSGCFQGESDTRNIGLARKIHSLIFLQCLQDYAIWLMTARCLALDDGSRAGSSGSQCAIVVSSEFKRQLVISCIQSQLTS